MSKFKVGDIVAARVIRRGGGKNSTIMEGEYGNYFNQLGKIYIVYKYDEYSIQYNDCTRVRVHIKDLYRPEILETEIYKALTGEKEL